MKQTINLFQRNALKHAQAQQRNFGRRGQERLLRQQGSIFSAPTG